VNRGSDSGMYFRYVSTVCFHVSPLGTGFFGSKPAACAKESNCFWISSCGFCVSIM